MIFVYHSFWKYKVIAVVTNEVERTVMIVYLYMYIYYIIYKYILRILYILYIIYT